MCFSSSDLGLDLLLSLSAGEFLLDDFGLSGLWGFPSGWCSMGESSIFSKDG